MAAGSDTPPPTAEVRLEERREQLREEARAAATYHDELVSEGFTETQALELVMHWQGYAWNFGENAP